MKKILVVFLSLLLCLFCACGENEPDLVEKFVLCIENDTFDEIMTVMHPDSVVTAEEIDSYFALLEKSCGVEFKGDFKITEYELEEYDDPEPTIKGEYLRATGITESDGARFTFDIKIVENEKAKGIYKIKFRPQDESK